MRWMLWIGLLAGMACADSPNTDSSDPCAEIDLPDCPQECPEDYASTCGEACESEGEECGNSIGDGRICQDGLWTCTVHSPSDGPDECNRVCN